MTRVYGVLGYPVSHSLSPIMHQAAFEARGLDALYTPFAVPAKDLKAVLFGLHGAGIDGLNVTIPHKERIVRALGRRASVDPVAKAVGAVNTLVRTANGFACHNTDVVGFRQVLAKELRVDCRGKHILLLGAGGAAKAVAWVLVHARPERITVANRTKSRADALRRWMRRQAPGVQVEVVPFERRALGRAIQEAELLVNTTSLGLRKSDPLPVDPAALRKGMAVADLVYRSPTTALVRAARRRGALAVDGLPMLVYQGAESFRLWWGRPAPVEAMRRAVERAARSA